MASRNPAGSGHTRRSPRPRRDPLAGSAGSAVVVLVVLDHQELLHHVRLVGGAGVDLLQGLVGRLGLVRIGGSRCSAASPSGARSSGSSSVAGRPGPVPVGSVVMGAAFPRVRGLASPGLRPAFRA
ncbi:hypothetical protein ACFQVA_28685 [Actinomadura keratinilytica]